MKLIVCSAVSQSERLENALSSIILSRGGFIRLSTMAASRAFVYEIKAFQTPHKDICLYYVRGIGDSTEEQL